MKNSAGIHMNKSLHIDLFFDPFISLIFHANDISTYNFFVHIYHIVMWFFFFFFPVSRMLWTNIYLYMEQHKIAQWVVGLIIKNWLTCELQSQSDTNLLICCLIFFPYFMLNVCPCHLSIHYTLRRLGVTLGWPRRIYARRLCGGQARTGLQPELPNPSQRASWHRNRRLLVAGIEPLTTLWEAEFPPTWADFSFFFCFDTFFFLFSLQFFFSG